jgi:hypothetical protein
MVRPGVGTAPAAQSVASVASASSVTWPSRSPGSRVGVSGPANTLAARQAIKEARQRRKLKADISGVYNKALTQGVPGDAPYNIIVNLDSELLGKTQPSMVHMLT